MSLRPSATSAVFGLGESRLRNQVPSDTIVSSPEKRLVMRIETGLPGLDLQQVDDLLDARRPLDRPEGQRLALAVWESAAQADHPVAHLDLKVESVTADLLQQVLAHAH